MNKLTKEEMKEIEEHHKRLQEEQVAKGAIFTLENARTEWWDKWFSGFDKEPLIKWSEGMEGEEIMIYVRDDTFIGKDVPTLFISKIHSDALNPDWGNLDNECVNEIWITLEELKDFQKLLEV